MQNNGKLVTKKRGKQQKPDDDTSVRNGTLSPFQESNVKNICCCL